MDTVLPVIICGKACLTRLVSDSMVSFRDYPGTTGFWYVGFRQKSKVYWDEYAVSEKFPKRLEIKIPIAVQSLQIKIPIALHLVFTAKYRRKVFSKTVEISLRDICLEIGRRYEIYFVEIGMEEDHVH